MSENKAVDIRGLLDTYEFRCTLPGSGEELLIKPLTTGQMKKILAYEDETETHVVENALDKLISDCVVTEGFDIDDLYLQDRFYLLLEIRKVSKGSKYSFNFKCPKCSVDNIADFSLDDLPVTSKPESDNVIEINEKLSFEVDFPTRRDQKDAMNRYKDRTDMSNREKEIEIMTGTFANSIRRVHTKEGILEDVPFEQKTFILDNIPTETFDKFKDWFDVNDFGVKFEAEVGCIHCSFRESTTIPLSGFFV